MNTIRIMMGNMSRNIMLNKVDETLLQVEGQIDQSDKIVSQLKEGINSLVKGQLPGQDCGCTNSGDGGAGDWSAVCDCVVGKSGGDDFRGEKRDNDCCDDLNWINRIERKEKNDETRERSSCVIKKQTMPKRKVAAAAPATDSAADAEPVADAEAPAPESPKKTKESPAKEKPKQKEAEEKPKSARGRGRPKGSTGSKKKKSPKKK
ncbi:histone H1, gonadal isoform X3 [Biomphalaria glabrata]|nr:histone H1, gonadal isoform X3 [Biomphalaria glabrata]